MSKILLTRSPYYVSISGSASDDTKVELFIYNSGSVPTTPTRTLSKPIPASTVTSCDYDISPYINEYINFESYANNTSTDLQATNTDQYAKVRIKRYLNGTLLDTEDVFAFYGYGIFQDGYNPIGDTSIGEQYLFSQSSFEYYSSNPYGQVTAWLPINYKVRYQDLGSSSYHEYTITSSGFYDLYLVYPSYATSGNTIEIYNASSTLIREIPVTPHDECRYTPIRVDYINRFGAWQTETFYKMSKNNFETNGIDYMFMHGTIDYNTFIGQKQSFNINGKDSIVVNTDWVSEDWAENLKQLMLSEKIVIDNYPVVLKTKSTELHKHINEKLINYTLEFEYAFNTINNV